METIIEIKSMSNSDIKAMLTSMNSQIKYAPDYSKKTLKELYRDHIDACITELEKRGVKYCN